MDLYLFCLLVVMSTLASMLVAQSPSLEPTTLSPTLIPTSQSPSLAPTYYPSLSPHSVGIITTIVGTGTASYSGDGGDATSATLNTPHGVTVDSSGNVYIGDTGNAVVRKLTIATGTITTIAGTGTSGSSGDGGAATSANLNSPCGVAVDTLGNIYIGDQGNCKVRMVTISTNIITTIAGVGVFAPFGGDGGQASSAGLNYPYSVAVYQSSFLYISDTGNCRVRMVDLTTGIITTVAGTGIATSTGDGGDATSATVKYPNQVAVHQSTRDVYICDYGNSKIRKITYSTGLMSTVFSGLKYPYGCTIDINGKIKQYHNYIY